MLEALRDGDTVIVCELTRLSRSTKDLFELVERTNGCGADVKSLKESWLDTTTPHGKLLFTATLYALRNILNDVSCAGDHAFI